MVFSTEKRSLFNYVTCFTRISSSLNLLTTASPAYFVSAYPGSTSPVATVTRILSRKRESYTCYFEVHW